jgi:hypothetical protein
MRRQSVLRAAVAVGAALTLAACASTGTTGTPTSVATNASDLPASASPTAVSSSGAPAASPSMAPVEVLPESVLSPMTGYAYVIVPTLDAMEKNMSSVNPQAGAFFSGVTIRGITFNGKASGTVFRFRCAPAAGVSGCGQFLLGFQKAWTGGVAAKAGKVARWDTQEAVIKGSTEGTVAFVHGGTAMLFSGPKGVAQARTLATAYIAATPSTSW